VAAADRLAAMWVLLVTSGMRPSEVLGLPWAAVDLEAEDGAPRAMAGLPQRCGPPSIPSWSRRSCGTASHSTTADTHTHVMPAHSAEAVRTVAALFDSPSRLVLPPTAGASDEA
jgi:hypothetical protein